MSEIGSFNGKLSFNADDMFWTLAGDAEDNKITLAKSSNTEENQADGRQLFNRYGDELSAIQAPNGLYLVYSEDLKAYTADEERTASPSLFTFEPANTTGVVLIENSDGKDYYVIADNGVLSRTKKTGDALAASIFTTTIVTKSIAEIISQRDGTKIDLTWAYLAGQNLTEIPFYQSTLDHAVLSGATVKSTQFADASLVSANLSNLVCESTNFSAAVLDHAVFTETTFDSLTRLTGASAIDVDFSATRFPVGMSLNNFEASGAVFDGATMAGVVMNGANLTAASMVAVNLKNASFNGADLSGALLTRSNLTGASMQTTQFVNAQLAAADFTDASLSEANFTNANLSNASLINARELTRLDFRGALLVAVDFTGFDFVRHQTKVSSDTDFTRAFLDNCTFTNMDLRGIRFLSASIRYAQMDGVNLEDATLTNADLSFVSATKQVSMIGANLSNAKLEGANLEGVQMGPLITHDDADLALSVDLDRGINPNLKLRLSAGSSLPKVTVLEPGEAWNLTANNCILMVRKAEDKLRIAEVDPHKTGAILTNAFMPNANLNQANMYAVDMSGVNWYGASASAKGANLESANLSQGNFSTMDFTQATMRGVNLSFCNLVNANFTGVKLLPTTGLAPVSLSFSSLEGTDFTDALLNSANVTNAAVCLQVEGSAVTISAVPVFTIPSSLAPRLNAGTVDQEIIDAFKLNDVTLTSKSPLAILSLGKIWAIRTTPSPSGQNYLIETNQEKGYLQVYKQGSETSEIDIPEIWAVPLGALPASLISVFNKGVITEEIRTAFFDVGYPLLPSAGLVPVSENKLWAVNNIDPEETSLQAGFGQFMIVAESFAGVTKLKLFGASPLSVIRMGTNNTQERVLVPFAPTVFGKSALGAKTTTPSGLKYELLGPALPFEFLMTAGLPPKPPECVPGPFNWC